MAEHCCTCSWANTRAELSRLSCRQAACMLGNTGTCQGAHRRRYIDTELYMPQPMMRSAPSASTTQSPVRGAGRPTMRSRAPLNTSGWPCANSLALPPLVTATGVPVFGTGSFNSLSI